MPSKLKKAIGAVKDQTSISLAKVASNHKSNLEVAVLKATTHDDIPVDERYVYEVVEFVSSSKVYASSCARAIGKRIGRTRNWIVALKSLMLVLRIFQDGDPYFPREVLHAMKRGAKILNLTSFRDDSNSSPWDFTAFVRTFSLYLDERLDCFLTGKLQRRCSYRDKVSPSAHHHRSRRPNEPVRDMKPVMLLDRISYWQRLLDRAIATRPTGSAKYNRLVQISLYAIVQETFDLYKDISDALALLLDSFFHLQYQSCVTAFHTCVKASKQFEELSAFYVFCKDIGVGRSSEYPSIQSISEELIETLQEFLKDQSSFTATTKSPSRSTLRLPAPPHPRYGRDDSYGGLSEFSTATGYSGRTSEVNSHCTSLEELISATENGISPAISIDLEAYSDQFEKQSQRDSAFVMSETGSTRSLPATSSMADMLSLCDWPDEDDKPSASSGRSSPNVFHESQRRPDLAKASRTKSFNAFPEATATTTSVQQEKSFCPQGFNAFPEATSSFSAIHWTTTPSAQSSNTSHTIFDVARPETQQLPFNAFPAASTSSAQSSKTSRANSFDVFADVSTSSTQSFLFNAFPEASAPSALSSKTKRTNSMNAFLDNGFGAFPEPTMPTTQSLPDLHSFNVFPHTATPSTQPSSTLDENFTGFLEHHLAPPLSGFSDYLDQGRKEGYDEQDDYSRSGWELALVETSSQSEQSTKDINNNSNISEFDNLFSLHPTPPTHYNPFLQDSTQLSAMSSQDLQLVPCSSFQPTFSVGNDKASEAAFEATPTFSAQQPNNMLENDPFAMGSTAFSSSEQMFCDSTSPQQNLLQQQQLWLQNQNKIIAKYRA